MSDYEDKNLELDMIKEKIEALEKKEIAVKQEVEDLKYHQAQINRQLNQIFHLLKIIFWVSIALSVSLLIFLIFVPPVIIGLWIIFGILFLAITLLYFGIRFTSKKIE